jgi:hypothetical protein
MHIFKWGRGRRERTRRNCHFPKIKKPKKIIFNGQKKGKKQEEFSFPD